MATATGLRKASYVWYDFAAVVRRGCLILALIVLQCAMDCTGSTPPPIFAFLMNLGKFRLAIFSYGLAVTVLFWRMEGKALTDRWTGIARIAVPDC
jgi:hypothetical protein